MTHSNDSGLPYDICRCLGGDETHGQCPRIATCHRATYPAGPRSPWMARVCEPHEYDAYIHSGDRHD